MFNIQPEMTETMKVNHFHAQLRKRALQIFRNIKAKNERAVEEILIVFRRKYVKLESHAPEL